MKTILATTGSGLARAVQESAGQWSVEDMLVGQEITSLAADPLQPGVVYAGTRGQGVLCSSDGGKSWAPAGLSGHTVKAVSASPLTPGVIYAGTKPALVFVSRDHGHHWEELSAFRRIFSRRIWFSPAEPPFSAYVQGIALSPMDPDVLVVGIEAGAVVRSVDGGRTWEDHRRGALRDCHTIAFHHTSGAWVYEAGGSGGGFAASQDAGNTWQQRGRPLDRHYGWACAADPLDPAIFYVSVSPSPMKAHGDSDAQAYIFRSNLDGTWQKLGGGLPQPLNHMPYALVTDPAEPGNVYAGMSSGEVWRSQDQGDTWDRLPFQLKGIHRSMILLPG